MVCLLVIPQVDKYSYFVMDTYVSGTTDRDGSEQLERIVKSDGIVTNIRLMSICGEDYDILYVETFSQKEADDYWLGRKRIYGYYGPVIISNWGSDDLDEQEIREVIDSIEER